MDNTAMALALIKAYRQQFNCVVRNERIVHNITNDPRFLAKMQEYGFSAFIHKKLGNGAYKEALRFFQNNYGVYQDTVYVSNGIKNAAIRNSNKQLKKAIEHKASIVSAAAEKNEELLPGILQRHDAYIKQLSDVLQETQDKPVDVELGKMWRTYVKAVWDGEKAYKAQYEVRSAIKVFNKINTGITIHFGTCRIGAMNRIHSVGIDGNRIPVRKFLDNAEFETAVLAAT